MQKNFALPEGGKRVDMPTFLWTARGPLFTFPERLYIARPQEVDIPQKERIFRKALDELLARFTDRSIRRVGVVHELVFDTGQLNPLEIVTSNLNLDDLAKLIDPATARRLEEGMVIELAVPDWRKEQETK